MQSDILCLVILYMTSLIHFFSQDCHPIIKALSSIDPLIIEGWAIMLKRKTPLHTDQLDLFHAWTTMITFRNFTQDSKCHIQCLKLHICHFPGDAIIICGRILAHEVKS